MSKELELAIKISGKIDRSLGAAFNNAQRQLDTINATTNRAMMSATVAAATAGAAIVVESTQKAMQYEKSMAGVAKVVDGCRDANGKLTDTYYELSNGILDVSTKIPMAAEGIASIVESAGQSGIAKTELLGFADSAAKMGIAFDTTAEQAGDWMAQWRTSMRLTQPQVEVLADQINYLGNTSSEKATKLAEVVSRVGSLGDIAGLSGGQVAALAASMPGVEAEISATGIKNLARAMTMGEAATKKQRGVLSRLGFSATDLANRMQTDATGAIMDLLEAMNKLPEAEQSAALSRYFGNESIAAIAPLLSNLENLEEQFAKVGDATRYSGSMQTEYEAAAATTANKVELLRNQVSKEMIELGNEITPVLSESIDKVSDKIPQLADQIGNSLERIIPFAADGFGYLIDNSDTILSTAEGLIKTFAVFKIGTGAIEGINSVATLAKNLSTVSKAAGAVPVIKGVLGTLTGASSTGAVASLASTLGPLAAVFGSVVALGAAYDHLTGRSRNYAAEMALHSQAMNTTANKLVEYNNLATEVNKLREIEINTGNSSTEIEAANMRLQEIADKLKEEYNLTVNVNTANLEKALSMTQQLNRTDLVDETTKLIESLEGGASKYRHYMDNYQNLEASKAYYATQQLAYGSIQSGINFYQMRHENGQITDRGYLAEMDRLYQEAMTQGLNFPGLGEHLNELSLGNFVSAVSAGITNADIGVNTMTNEITKANEHMNAFNTDAQTAMQSMARVLANDVQNLNASGVRLDVEMFESLGRAMNEAGMSTQNLSVQFATAQMGYTSFADAIANSKAAEAAQGFYNYQTAIGVSAETATAGAALIQNGFENAAQATAAGNDAILNVIANINSLGAMNGVFDGLTDTADIEAKLTSITRAMNLIPANKAVKFDIGGNLSLIEQTATAVNETPQAHNTELTANGNALNATETLTAVLRDLPSYKSVTIDIKQNGIANIPIPSWSFVNGSHYSGLERVPFDGYIAELHKDERVLTAAEAAAYDSLDDSPASIDVLRESILAVSGGGDSDRQRHFVFSPTITVQGNADKDTIETTVKMTYNDFLEFMEEYDSDNRRKRF